MLGSIWENRDVNLYTFRSLTRISRSSASGTKMQDPMTKQQELTIGSDEEAFVFPHSYTKISRGWYYTVVWLAQGRVPQSESRQYGENRVASTSIVYSKESFEESWYPL